MTSSLKNVVGIVRVSTEDQAADDRAGLPRQRDAIARVATNYNLRVKEIIELAGVSGTVTKDMPEIRRVLRMVRQKEICGVVLADLDRLFRLKRPGDLEILNDFETAQATIWTDSGIFDYSTDNGTTLSIMRGLFSGLELRAIKRRVQQARENKRRNGELAGAKIILPQGVDYDRKTKAWSYTSDVVKVQEAFRLVDEESLTNMSELGRRLGVQPATLRIWLRNPIYMGIRRIEWKRGEEYGQARKVWLPGERRDRKKVRRAPEEVIEKRVFQEPAVDPERWARVQAILNDTRQRWKRQRSTAGTEVNLGSGLLTCGYCRGRLYASSGRRKNQPDRPGYYYCRQNHYLSKQKGNSCPQINIQKRRVDELLSAFVADYLVEPDVLGILGSRLQQSGPPRQNVASSLEELGRRENRWLDAYESGVIDAAKLKERMLAIEAERIRLSNISAEQERRASEVRHGDAVLKALIAGAFAFRRLSALDDRKLALSQMFSEVTLTGCSITSFRSQIGLPTSFRQNDTRTGRGSSRRRA